MKEQTFHIRLIDKVSCFLLGLINNLPYVIGIASATRIVDKYEMPGYTGLVLWANNLSGIFARFINTWLVSCNVRYEIIFAFNCVLMALGLIGCAFTTTFWITLIAIFFIGFSSNLGESVVLCYIAYRRKEPLLKSWSSGTGMAGITGASYSLIFAFLTPSDTVYFYSFIGVLPVVVVYALCYYLILVKSPSEVPEERNVIEKIDNSALTINDSADLNDVRVGDGLPEKGKICDPVVWKLSWFPIMNCGAVYFLEYIIQGAFNDACLNDDQKPYWTAKIYPLLNLMYQIGVFMSRSSLTFFQFPWVGILTLIQLGFADLWLMQSLLRFMPIGVMLFLMVLVGLFGGCSYVNVFHLIMTTPQLSTKQKEMATNWNSFFISVFIIFSTLFSFLAEKTFITPNSS